MGIFNNIDKYIENITKKIQGSNAKIDANNNYDMEQRKLTNVAEGTESSHAITSQNINVMYQ